MESPRLFLKESVVPFVRRRAFVMEASCFALAMLLGRVEILEAALPFGTAFVLGADMAGVCVYYPLAGAALGALLQGEIGYGALFTLSLYMLLRTVCPLIFKRLLKVDKLLLIAGVQLLTLSLFYLGTLTDFLRGLSAMGLVLLFGIGFQNAIRALKDMPAKRKLHEEEQIALCLLIGALSLACAEATAYDFSLSLLLIVWAAMFAAYTKGLSAVAAAVSLCGMLLLGGKGQPLLLADIALCTLSAVLLRRMGAWGAALGFCICCSVTEAYLPSVTGQRIGLINAIPAALAFVSIPKSGMLYLRAAVDSGAREEKTARAIWQRMQTQAAEDITRTAQTVEDIAGLFASAQDEQYDIDREQSDMLRAAMHVCAACVYRGACWRDKEAASRALFSMLPAYSQGRRPRPPAPFQCDCIKTPAIAAAAVQARDAYRERAAQAKQSAGQRAFINRQLHGVGHIMRSLSTDVKERGWPDEGDAALLKRRLAREGIIAKRAYVHRGRQGVRVELHLNQNKDLLFIEEAVSAAMERPMRLLRVREYSRDAILDFEQAHRMRLMHGSASAPKRGSAMSGDSAGHANLPNGQALYVLSDGMGTGVAARDKSKKAVDMLIKLYEVGYTRDTSLECVNRLLMKEGEEIYATLDALHIDLKSGAAEFIKFGASPSFVLREGKVHTVYAEALPAGILDEACPAVHAASLKKNDMLVLLTDGVIDALKEETNEEILRCAGGANTCDEAAQALLHAARERGSTDDMTALVIRVA